MHIFSWKCTALSQYSDVQSRTGHGFPYGKYRLHECLIVLISFQLHRLSQVNSTKTFIAYGESGIDGPICYVLEYPSLQLMRLLRGGGVKQLDGVAFNAASTLMATVGGAPDFTLSIWDWKQEQIVLRSKAFSQVDTCCLAIHPPILVHIDSFSLSWCSHIQPTYTLAFHPEISSQIITAGYGHVKFWKMDRTFTGLKLCGNVGKFGSFEASSVYSFVHLPDGKVLTGSDSGCMYLWECLSLCWFTKFRY